ncbi:SPFH domain-containing protein [Marinigracilibium pacificum]|uniref:SPFH domain-containing protein n=1 Tax=Marinigracilibium pacificum TaxID=2729599 RepID=A0A848IZE1_9BACT|nr:SPFH domain-containing protein [Marinigracilibium pacificum]NMM47660.1 SPFH domain-containing protein [Marinigracilibium pacificum]
MGIFDKLRNEFIDIIEWTDSSNDTLVYRFERHQNEIKNGAKLTVREGQMAVFVNEGQIADIFEPGMYTLNTENLPILSTLKGWKYGFNSPFKAEVYFVSTRNITAQKWGTKNPITLSDNRFGMFEIRAFGTYVLKVDDPKVFLREIVGTDGHFTTEEIAEQLKSLIVTRFTDAAGEAEFPVEAFASNLNELSEFIAEAIGPDFAEYGIKITKFLVENVSMPEEIKKEIFELSRLNAIDLNKLAQMKAAKAMEKAAENPSGTAGAGMGMGMGFAMANQMGNAFSQGQQPQAQQQQPSQATPPPIPPALTFHVVINGQQAGPYDMNTLKQMASQNQFTRETLVWREGMANWAAANTLSELDNIFGSVPPPIPGQ